MRKGTCAFSYLVCAESVLESVSAGHWLLETEVRKVSKRKALKGPAGGERECTERSRPPGHRTAPGREISALYRYSEIIHIRRIAYSIPTNN